MSNAAPAAPTVPATPAGAGAPTVVKLSPRQRLEAAITGNADLTAALAEISAARDGALALVTAITSERDLARTDLVAAQARVTELTNEITPLRAAAAAVVTERAQLATERAALPARASAAAVDIVAGAGIPAREIPRVPETPADGAEALCAQYRELQAKDAHAAAKFYAANKDKMFT